MVLTVLYPADYVRKYKLYTLSMKYKILIVLCYIYKNSVKKHVQDYTVYNKNMLSEIQDKI